MKMWNCKLLVLLLDIWMVTSIIENQIASVLRVVFHLFNVINRSKLQLVAYIVASQM